MIKIKKKIAGILTLSMLVSQLFLFNTTVVNAISSSENEFKSTIQNFTEDEIIVENGVSLRFGETLDLSEYPNWSLSNDKTVAIEDGIVKPVGEGTVFLSQKIGDKVHIIEIYTSNQVQKYSIDEDSKSKNRSYYKVFVDPGHGGADNGASAFSLYEDELNLKVATKVTQKLESKGIQVKMSRTSDVFLELSERARLANEYGADVFVSVHQNSFETDESVNGIETYYHKDKVNHKPLSSNIQTNAIKYTGSKDRKVKSANFAVLRESNMPSALFESGFITNKAESQKLASDQYQDKLASAIADGVEKYLKENIQLEEPIPQGTIKYQTHVQDYGWQSWRVDGNMSGTSGESKRLEAIKISLGDAIPGASINYRTHVQDYGWQLWKSNGDISGTSGESKRLEALEIKLENAPGYKVEYRVHVQDYGWQPWKSNGEIAGTIGKSKRLEALEVRVVKEPKIEYRAHVQDYGWQSWKSNGEMSGTSDEAKRLEALEIKIVDAPEGSKLSYRTHVQNYGWQSWKNNGEMSGTTGEEKRIEAIEIKLENAQGYKVEYRAHTQDQGWQGWKSNGEIAGTIGESKRLEAVEVRIVKN